MGDAKGADRAPERFSGLLLRHRGRSGLTQRQLAARVGVNRRALQDWEAGVNCPTAQRLQSLIAALLDADGLTSGHEADEAEELWTAAEREATRAYPPFDHGWFTRLLADQAVSQAAGRPGALPERVVGPPPWVRTWTWPLSAARTGAKRPICTTSSAAPKSSQPFSDWVLDERCRLVAVLGMGGIGKTSLAARLAQRRGAGLSARVLAQPAQRAAGRRVAGWRHRLPVRPAARATGRRGGAARGAARAAARAAVPAGARQLRDAARARRSARAATGTASAATARCCGRSARAGHQSCLVLTSREAPPELAALGGAAVRSFALGGLDVAEGRTLLAAQAAGGRRAGVGAIWSRATGATAWR